MPDDMRVTPAIPIYQSRLGARVQGINLNHRSNAHTQLVEFEVSQFHALTLPFKGNVELPYPDCHVPGARSYVILLPTVTVLASQ
jgi:hypothetical protein